MRTVELHRLGQISYAEGWKYQETIFKNIVQHKIKLRNGETDVPTKDHLIVCEHPHVYTLGKSGSIENLLLNEEELDAKEIEFFKIDRGGDITYHGLGQLVVYPILDLEHYFTDIHKYLRMLEEAVILTLAEYGIVAGRSDGLTGVWIDPSGKNPRKICAMGVKCSRWVTMHGIGFNINTDLSYFSNIIPCGIENKAVTSLKEELKEVVQFEQLTNVLLEKIAYLFNFNYGNNNEKTTLGNPLGS
jgi:lipoyl(octanoyl) transferase